MKTFLINQSTPMDIDPEAEPMMKRKGKRKPPSNSLAWLCVTVTLFVLGWICFLPSDIQTPASMRAPSPTVPKIMTNRLTPLDTSAQVKPVWLSQDQLRTLFAKLYQMLIVDTANQTSSTVTRSQLERDSQEFHYPKSHQTNNSEMFQLVENESNVAAVYWNQWEQHGSMWKKSEHRFGQISYCDSVSLPNPVQLRFENIFWQKLDIFTTSANGEKQQFTMFLYSAYYDNRMGPAVKVFTVTDRQTLAGKTNFTCMLWFDQLTVPVMVDATEVYNIWPVYWTFGMKDGVFGSQMITCIVPTQYSNQVPRAVSLQQRAPCEKMNPQPSNALRVVHNQRNTTSSPTRPSIGVCVQAFRFGAYENSVRLVEWLEMVRLMGADQVYLYVLGATKSMYRVLEHYQKQGFVNWRRITLPGDQPNIEHMYNFYAYKKHENFWPEELIELNDCLYRNIYRHDYIVVMDIDEMIMPQTVFNWHELIGQIQKRLSPHQLSHKASYVNRHSYVYEMFEEKRIPPSNMSQSTSWTDIPDYLYMMRHTYRQETYNDSTNAKSIHRTDLVTAVHNHLALRCVNRTGYHSCDYHYVDIGDSIMMHYRRSRQPPKVCLDKTNSFNVTGIQCSIHDRTVWRYFALINDTVHRQLNELFNK